jgi:hypothetical protein
MVKTASSSEKEKKSIPKKENSAGKDKHEAERKPEIPKKERKDEPGKVTDEIKEDKKERKEEKKHKKHKKEKKEKKHKKEKRRSRDYDDDDDDDQPLHKKSRSSSESKPKALGDVKGKGAAKAKVEEETVFEWWNSTPLPDGVKWSNLEHNGVLFPPDYVQHHKEFRYRSVCR